MPRNLLPALYDKVRTFNDEAHPGFLDAWRPNRAKVTVAPEDMDYHLVEQQGVVSRFSATGGFDATGNTWGARTGKPHLPTLPGRPGTPAGPGSALS